MDSDKATVVEYIKLLMITSLTPMLSRYPLLRQIFDSSKNKNFLSDWDFFMTAAGVGIVLLSSEQYKDEHERIKARLNKLDKEYMRAIEDLSGFIEKTRSEGNQLIATVGAWILWNVNKHEPTDQESLELCFPVGHFVIQTANIARVRLNTV